jgi:hypothetical protein
MLETSEAFVFTYPFWIYINHKDPPRPIHMNIDGRKVRFYPPFRNAPPTFVNQSRLEDPKKVPFLPGKQPDYATFLIVPPPVFIFKVKDTGEVNESELAGFSEGPFQGPSPLPEDAFPKDGMRLDITATDHTTTTGIAYEVSSRLMQLLRWRSGQWWISRSMAGITQIGPLQFSVNSDGGYRRKPQLPTPIVAARTPSGHEQSVNHAIWTQSITDLVDGTEVPVHELLMADARYFFSIGDLRQAVLEADGACEYLKEITFDKLWSARNPGRTYDKAKREDLLRNWDLPRHLDEKFQNHFRRSYKGEHPTEWNEINNLWSARNNVAHGAPTEFGDPPVKVDEAIMQRFMDAATHCTRWLMSLQVR